MKAFFLRESRRRIAWSALAATVLAALPLIIILAVKPHSDSPLTIFVGLLILPGQRLAFYLFHVGAHDGLPFLEIATILNWILFAGTIAALWSVLAFVRGRKRGGEKTS